MRASVEQLNGEVARNVLPPQCFCYGLPFYRCSSGQKTSFSHRVHATFTCTISATQPFTLKADHVEPLEQFNNSFVSPSIPKKHSTRHLHYDVIY